MRRQALYRGQACKQGLHGRCRWRYARGNGNSSTQAVEVVAMTIDRGGPLLGLELLQMAMMP